MEEHNGFFKAGDYIEVSGKPEGIVVDANEKYFAIRPFFERNANKEPKLGTFIKLYSNDRKNYKHNYWIRVIKEKAPFEYRVEELSIFNLR